MPVEIRELQTTIPGAENPMQVTCKLLIEGGEIPADIRVASIEIERAINKIPSATVHIIDGDVSRQTFEISDGDLFVPGKKIEIQLGYQTDAATVFKGLIVGISNRISGSETELQLQCRDEAVKMTVARKFAHFNDLTDSDLAEQLIGNYSYLQSDIESTSITHDNMVQYNMSDWDFMLHRMDRLGMFCTVEDGKITIKKPDLNKDKIFDVIYGSTLVNYQASIDARWQPSQALASSWNPDNQEVTTVTASETSLQQAGDIPAADLADGVGYSEDKIQLSAQYTDGQLQALAEAKLQKQRLARIKGKVKFQGAPQAKPGEFIMVAGVGNRFSGPLFASTITHTYEDGNWLTEAQLGIEPEWFAERINPGQSTAAQGLLHGIPGLQIGVVVDNEDPLNAFRVRVRMPAVNGEEEGVWARLATLDAGDNRGTFFRPEIGDEVVLGFISGDPSQPLILGMLHSTAKPAPLSPSDNNDEKGYVSRSQFKMIFNDDQKSLSIESPGGKKFTINDNDGIIKLEDENGNKITFESGGVTVEAAASLTLKAGSEVKIEAAQININGSGMTNIKGGMVNIN